MPGEATGPVTTCVTYAVIPGKEADFERGLAQVGEVASGFPGHQGLTVVRPSGKGGPYVAIFRFDTYDHLSSWEVSPACAAWKAKAGQLTAKPVDKRVLTGLEYWFALPEHAAVIPPPAWKMVIVTFVVLFPLSQMLPRLLGPPLSFLPPLGRSFAITLLLLCLMTYAVMPAMVRLLRPWLFPAARP